MSAFRRAERKQAKLRCSLTGASGSGKTYGALLLARGIGGKVACIDTEHGSASLYSDLLDFDVAELQPPYSPERYVELIRQASAEYDVLVIDSISHEWTGQGGVLEIVDKLAKASNSGNSYFAWGNATPRHNAFIDSMLQAPCHLIATMRSKQDFVLQQDAKGRQVPQKVGMAPVQRDGMDYEFTLVLDVNQASHAATASKDRTRLFSTRPDPFELTEDDGRELRDWLTTGVDSEAQAIQEREATEEEFAQALREAKTRGGLKSIYRDAFQWASKSGDSGIIARLDGIKNYRKAELEPDEKEQEQPA